MRKLFAKFLIIIYVIFLSSGIIHAKKWYEFWKNDNKLAAATKEKKEALIRSTWKEDYLYNTAYYRDYDSLYDLEMVNMILEGLKEKPSVIRWYCAYKISDYLDFVDKDSLKLTLIGMKQDSVEQVRNAAAFTLSLINRNYDKEWFKKSPDGKKIVFTKYNGVRYNNSGIWMIYRDKIFTLITGPKLGDTDNITWSPDSKNIAFTINGRPWQYVKIVDINLGEKNGYYDVRSLLDYIRTYSKKYDLDDDWSHNDPWPWLSIVEWRPDGKQILFSYSYNGKNRNWA